MDSSDLLNIRLTLEICKKFVALSDDVENVKKLQMEVHYQHSPLYSDIVRTLDLVTRLEREF